MMGCPHCNAINEAAVRQALTDRKPLYVERIEMAVGWHRITETNWQAKFFCDACGTKTTIIVTLIDEPDPSDWWKV